MKALITIFLMVTVSSYGMHKIPLELHTYIASYVLSTDDKKALENFHTYGQEENNTWSPNRAWSVLGFMQNSPIKGYYIQSSLAEMVALSKEQRMTLKEVFKNRDESRDYSWDFQTPRSMFTTLSMTEEQKTILEQCPNQLLGIFLGKRNQENTHEWFGSEINNSTLVPEYQDIFVTVSSRVTVQPRGEFNFYQQTDALYNAFCSGNIYQLGKEIMHFAFDYINSKEFYYYSSKDWVLTNQDNRYYFIPFALTLKPDLIGYSFGPYALKINNFK